MKNYLLYLFHSDFPHVSLLLISMQIWLLNSWNGRYFREAKWLLESSSVSWRINTTYELLATEKEEINWFKWTRNWGEICNISLIKD